MFALLLAPFAVLVAVGFWKVLDALLTAPRPDLALGPPPPRPRPAAARWLHLVSGAVSVALWNYMGWDNASTVAQEVERPSATTLLRCSSPPPSSPSLIFCRCLRWRSPASPPTGSPPAPGPTPPTPSPAHVFGASLALAVVLGGTINGLGMFNALMLSYARVPYALAKKACSPASSPSPNAKTGASPGSAFCSAPSPGRSPSSSPLSASSPSISSSTAPSHA